MAPGRHLSQQIQSTGPAASPLKLLEQLLQTKHAQIFAESAVAGDGTDWNATELSLLGDISIATDVEIYDDGRLYDPVPHRPPFQGTLLFTCGALFRTGYSTPPPDEYRNWGECVRRNELGPQLGASTQAQGLVWHHLPIRDVSVPDASLENAWQAIGPDLRQRLRRGEGLVVHCRGGLGPHAELQRPICYRSAASAVCV